MSLAPQQRIIVNPLDPNFGKVVPEVQPSDIVPPPQQTPQAQPINPTPSVVRLPQANGNVTPNTSLNVNPLDRNFGARVDLATTTTTQPNQANSQNLFTQQMQSDPAFAASHSGATMPITGTDLAVAASSPAAILAKAAMPLALSGITATLPAMTGALAKIATMGNSAKVTIDPVPTFFDSLGRIPSNPKIISTMGTAIEKILTSTSKTIVSLNPNTGQATTRIITESGRLLDPKIIVATITSAVAAWAGTRAWSQHLKVDNLIYGWQSKIRQYENAGEVEAAAEAREYLNEVLNPDLWQKMQEEMPFINLFNTADRLIKQAITFVDIDKKIADDNKVAIATGETDTQKWDRIRQQQIDQEKANIDYYNAQRKLMIEWEQAAKDKQDKKQAEFWAKEAEKQRQLEEEDRKAQAEFWLAYKKRLQEISDDSRPSKLNFGIV